MLRGVLLALVRRRWLGSLVGLVFEHFSWLLPVKRVLDGEQIVAFHHPRPSQPEHILFVPKKAIKDIVQLSRPSNTLFFSALLRSVVVAAADCSAENWTLKVSGGSNRDVPQVHFHFLPEFQMIAESDPAPLTKIRTMSNAVVYTHVACPDWAMHLMVVLQPQPSLQELLSAEGTLADALLRAVTSTIEDFALDENPYSVAIQMRENQQTNKLTFHIVSEHLSLPRWRRSGSSE